MNRKSMVAAATLLGCAVVAPAEPWPGWRGPEGNGICREPGLPLQWSTNQNVTWRVPLPEPGNSTPAVWGGRVFVTQPLLKENRRTLMCFDTQNGKLLWERGLTWLEKEPSYPENPPCTASPAVDGKRVIAWFGSAGVYCYDFRGRELWHRDLGRVTHDWGYASSLLLWQDRCFLNFGPGAKSFVVALDKKTGKTLWKFDLPRIPATAKWEEFGGDAQVGARPGAAKVSDIAASWATPLLVHGGARDELAVALALQLIALSPRTGQKLWSCSGPNIGAYSSAFSGDGIIGLTACGLKNTALAVTPGGNGDVTATHRLWFQTRPDSKSCIGSGVIFEGHVYLGCYEGMAECLDLKTGKTLWQERLTGTGARNGIWASPILAGDRLFIANRNADVFVLRASPTFECLATNSIGSEPMNASLAASDGSFYLRTDKALWRVAESQRPIAQ